MSACCCCSHMLVPYRPGYTHTHTHTFCRPFVLGLHGGFKLSIDKIQRVFASTRRPRAIFGPKLLATPSQSKVWTNLPSYSQLSDKGQRESVRDGLGPIDNTSRTPSRQTSALFCKNMYQCSAPGLIQCPPCDFAHPKRGGGRETWLRSPQSYLIFFSAGATSQDVGIAQLKHWARVPTVP